MPGNPPAPPRPRRRGAQSGCRLGAQLGRRRGAQQGNNNALKHGFYARNLPAKDTAGLDDLPLDALADEITLLRILIRRVAEKTGAHQSLEESMQHLRLVTFAMTCLARLMRTQTYIGINPSRGNPLQELLDQAIRQVNSKWSTTGVTAISPAEPSSANNGEQISPLELY